ncbi:hypothetical protein DYB36_006974 [Aphanomyces astaci]|uniref:Uncharacterized protein n=1 Tax=Aphanomyces astaci TaxID=112090 RepID=A0A397AA38_APHAT|nr:hypothetical protein DYB36_006974 [Aphanomyces astaci]
MLWAPSLVLASPFLLFVPGGPSLALGGLSLMQGGPSFVEASQCTSLVLSAASMVLVSLRSSFVQGGGPSLVPWSRVFVLKSLCPFLVPGSPSLVPGSPSLVPGSPSLVPGSPSLGLPSLVQGGLSLVLMCPLFVW